MKSIIVGTAGHIDHGKTALVKALTGIDADRLAEEKRRGITIDLGFAHMDLSTAGGETLRLGFVDVPGHERFVRNMLAGVGGIDLVLLVIAADESIKPQTREHFDILQLLGVERGLAVLTKSDAVDSETLDVVRLEVEEFLRGTFLDKPDSIVPVSSRTGAGLDTLKQAIVRLAAAAPARDSLALTRLPIDRVFSMKGFGTVVTGTLVAGTVHAEDELELLPARRHLRVRGVQVHGSAAQAAVAGQRTALNLASVGTDEIARGMTLASPSTFDPTRRADVSLTLLRSAPRPLKNHHRVHFHSYTMETIAEIVLHPPSAPDSYAPIASSNERTANPRSPQLLPGEHTFARFKLAQPALLLPGDRFIIRQFSPVVTIGGGIVLDAAIVPRMTGHADFLKILAAGNSLAILQARIARHGQNGISLSQLVSETGWTKYSIESQLAQPLKEKRVLRIGDRFIHAPAMHALREFVLSAVASFHKDNSLVPGIAKEELREQVKASPEIFAAALELLNRERKLESAGDLVRLPGRGVAMKDEEAESKKQIEEAFSTAGLKVPALHEVLAGLKIDRARAQKIVTLLLRDKALVKISDELVFHRSALTALRAQIAAYKSKAPKIDVAAFKELTGVSRKYAIPLLEYLDRERVTRRVGDVREIL